MDDPPEFTDPIILPIRITIPDPRPAQDTGRWGQLGPAIHPSFSDPGWFRRQREAEERQQAVLAQWPGGLPLRVPLLLPGDPGYVRPPKLPGEAGYVWPESLAAVVERARRRAQHASGEIGRGEYGSAAGHLLLGSPFPAEVDAPGASVVHSEGPEEDKAAAGEVRSPDLDAKIAEVEKDFKDRLADSLNDAHRQAAKDDLAGTPVTRGNRRFDHLTEVRNSVNGLKRRIDDLERKIVHNDRYIRPIPEHSISVAQKLITKNEKLH